MNTLFACLYGCMLYIRENMKPSYLYSWGLLQKHNVKWKMQVVGGILGRWLQQSKFSISPNPSIENRANSMGRKKKHAEHLKCYKVTRYSHKPQHKSRRRQTTQIHKTCYSCLCEKKEVAMVRCLSAPRKGQPQINKIYLLNNIKKEI